MKILERTKLEIGTVIKRFETEKASGTKPFQVLSLKDFNEALGEQYRGVANEEPIYVEEDNIPKLTIADKEQLVIHLLTQRAVVLPGKCAGYVIPSNFVKVTLEGDLYAPYYEWYFNNHPMIQRQIAKMSQGSATTTFTLKDLKEIEIEVPSFEKQQLIGDIYLRRKVKVKLTKEIIELENQVLQQKFIGLLEGGKVHE